MHPQRKQLWCVLGSLLILLGISVIRQFPADLPPVAPLRPCLVYLGYMVLLSWWAVSLHRRITQKSMRRCLQAEAGIMMSWMTTRWLQDAFLTDHLLLLRLSGYLIFIPILWIPLMGFIAACSLGRGDDYRIDRRWYLLLVPAGMLTVLCLTDPLHHIVYEIVESEPQPNLYFHPAVGLGLVILWAIGMEAARVVMMCRQNQLLKNQSAFRRSVPFLQVLLMLLFTLPYLMQSFYVEKELIEFSAGVFFIEALFWEICIAIGLIPVNTQHEMVFHQSTVGMQILDHAGTCLTRAQNSAAISPELFVQLKQDGMVLRPDGYELWMQPIHGGYMVWQKEVSTLHRTINQLHASVEALREESILLSQELKTKSERTAVQEKNRIYNQLTAEVSDQLETLKRLLRKKELCLKDPALMRGICLIGTYIKRRCNLRLIEQADHCITVEDLRISFHDLLEGLRELGLKADMRWNCTELSSPAFAIAAFDLFWDLLESETKALRGLYGVFQSPGVFILTVESTRLLPAQTMERLQMHANLVLQSQDKTGYTLCLQEGRFYEQETAAVSDDS